jgi:hypothetical protein
MPTEIFNDLMSRIHLISPYERFDAADYDFDLQGWASTSPVFESLIGKMKPSLIIEVGTWKGASAITMAGALKVHSIASAIICVDTWLGTFDVTWENPKSRESLALKHGYPTLYYQFLANVVKTGYSNIIIPLPSPSAVAFRWFRRVGVVADLIYIDADHDAESVYNDIRNYWQLLSPNGVLFGDDYLPVWPGVVRAVNVFSEKIGIKPQILREKWILRK